MITKRSTLILISAAAFGIGASFASAQNLLLHYDFNNITDNTVKDLSGNGRDGTISGSAVGLTPGVGTSGLNGDYAFNNTNSAMSGAGGGVRVTNANFGALSSFTVTMWYKTDGSQILAATRLFDNGNQLLAMDGVAGTESGNVIFSADGRTRVRNGTSNSIIQQSDTWIFVALTFDGTLDNNQIKLYVGDDATSASLIAQSNLTWANMTWDNSTLAFGSNTGNGRALDGYLDNIRFYGQETGAGSALNLEQLNAIRTQDLTTVPEPSTYALLAGLLTFGLALATRRRRQK